MKTNNINTKIIEMAAPNCCKTNVTTNKNEGQVSSRTSAVPKGNPLRYECITDRKRFKQSNVKIY